VSLRTDPHAWLRPYYAQLRSRPEFVELSESEQFDELCNTVIRDHPAEVAQMRRWPPGLKDDLLTHLASSAEQTPPAVTSQLWRLGKDTRELRCIVQYLASGMDVRVYEGDGVRRSQLCHDATAVSELSTKWKRELEEGGWHELENP
jgi:hypothetical protein